MTKILSEQLCEIVGLGKRRIEDKSFCWCDNCKYKFGFDSCQRPDGKPCPPHYKLAYPDFEQPKNFVKLFNLELAKNQDVRQTLATLITKKFELTVDSKHFISQVMRLIQYAFYYQVDAELIKQSIRDYDGWVWG